MNAREMASLAINVYGAMQKEEEFRQLLELAMRSPHETVLEIGSGHGGTLWTWSHLPNNKTVISVDLPGGDFGGGLTDMDKECIANWIDPQKNTFLCAADSHDPNTFYEVADTLVSIQEIKREKSENGNESEILNNPYIVDILFIDGDHTYEGVKKDFEMYSPLVRQGGLIVFHDICDHSETAPSCKVKEFWDGLNLRWINSEFISEPQTWGGIGVIHF